MRNLLHIAASARGEHSHSYQAACKVITRLRQQHTDLIAVERDIGICPLPHPDNAFVQASLTPAASRDIAQREALAQSEILIDELADSTGECNTL